MKLHGEVRKGQLVTDPAGLVIALREFEGQRVTVEIEREKAIRSLKQNAYYHACIVPVIAHILTEELRKEMPDAPAVTNDEAHQALKRDVLGKILVGGLEVVRSTTRLTTVGFNQFIERGRQIAAEAGFYIPEPGSGEEVLPA